VSTGPRVSIAQELGEAELRALVARLEQGIAETAVGFTRGMIWVAGLFFALAGLFAIRTAWGIAAVVAAFGVGIVLLGRVAARRNSPGLMAPVVAAISVQPDRIVSIGHRTSSDSRGIFVTHWIEARTADRHLLVKANDDWKPLLDLLARRCPRAENSR